LLNLFLWISGSAFDVLLCLPFLERFLPLTPLTRRRSCAGLRLSKNCANAH
jgi:hypothetical protein